MTYPQIRSHGGGPSKLRDFAGPAVVEAPRVCGSWGLTALQGTVARSGGLVREARRSGRHVIAVGRIQRVT